MVKVPDNLYFDFEDMEGDKTLSNFIDRLRRYAEICGMDATLDLDWDYEGVRGVYLRYTREETPYEKKLRLESIERAKIRVREGEEITRKKELALLAQLKEKYE